MKILLDDGRRTATINLIFDHVAAVHPDRDETVDQNEMDFIDGDSGTRVIEDRREFDDPLEQLIAAEDSADEFGENADVEDENQIECCQDTDARVGDYIERSLREEKYPEDVTYPHFFGFWPRSSAPVRHKLGIMDEKRVRPDNSKRHQHNFGHARENVIGVKHGLF